MEPPSALYMECPTCGRTPHRVIRGRISKRKEFVLQGVFRCLRCGFTRHETYREGLVLEVPMIVSDGGDSWRSTLELKPGETIEVGDSFEAEGATVKVTGIEAKGGRVGTAAPEDIETLWVKKADKVLVKFSLSKGGRTLNFSREVPADEEFEVGTIVELGKDRGVIHRVKTDRTVLREGAARADEIRRVYCKAMRHGRHEPERGGRGR